jgi:hypothetical protein
LFPGEVHCEHGRVQIVAIETDAVGAASLAEAVRGHPGIEFDTREVLAQVGDPDTWMFVAQMAPAAVSSLSAALIALIRQRKIKYVKVGDLEFRDITAGQFSAVLAALDGSHRDRPR